MLDTNRQQPPGFQFQRFAVTAQRPDLAVLDPLNLFIEAGYRQTALLHRFFFAVQYFHLRVDKHPGLVLVLGQIHNDDLFVNVHLGGGKANARRIVHGLQHVVDQLAVGVRHLLNRLGDGAQAGIRVFENL